MNSTIVGGPTWSHQRNFPSSSSVVCMSAQSDMYTDIGTNIADVRMPSYICVLHAVTCQHVKDQKWVISLYRCISIWWIVRLGHHTALGDRQVKGTALRRTMISILFNVISLRTQLHEGTLPFRTEYLFLWGNSLDYAGLKSKNNDIPAPWWGVCPDAVWPRSSIIDYDWV